MIDTKIYTATIDRIKKEWPNFIERRNKILKSVDSGRVLHEKDMEEIFRSLAEGPLGYEIENIGAQQDYADFALLDRGMKISVVEIKKYKYFEYQNQQLFEAIKQGARYAKRHRTPFIMAFDGCKLVLAKHIENSNMIIIIFNIDISSVEPDMNLFHFTHYGIFRCPDCEVSSFKYDAENDEGLFKDHKGEKLPISSYAYVGDIRNKSTWKLPYRHPDGKVNTDRIGKAVAYLLNPAGYRGKKATDEKLPVGATTLVALRLAKAYKEIDQWKRPNVIFRSNEKPNSQEMLWLYLYQKGIEDLLE